MSTKDRHQDAYQAGYLEAQLEQLGISPFTDADEQIAELICQAEARGDREMAERLTGASRLTTPPSTLTPDEQGDWWIAFYAGRRAARRSDDQADH